MIDPSIVQRHAVCPNCSKPATTYDARPPANPTQPTVLTAHFTCGDHVWSLRWVA